MHDDAVTASWRRLIDRLREWRSESVHDAFAGTPGAATAACRRNSDGEATQQAARLATWEDEGGTTPS
jgi:multimeric flavodoxin WrbA